jgi:hypothetical protein
VDTDVFFPPGARAMVLPNRRHPRLYLLSQDPLQRWQHTSFYPATRPRAKLYRLSVRLRAAMGLAPVAQVRSGDWPLGEFVEDVMPQTCSAIVLVGTHYPTRHLTAQLRDGKGRVLGYLKYAESSVARARLRQEWDMLSNLPEGIASEPVKFGPFGNGEAMLESALAGKPPPPTLPPPEDIMCLLESLPTSSPMSLEAHPWVRRMRDGGPPQLDTLLEPLAERAWPLTVHHGDFAPWNLIRLPDGTLRVIDWEYGTLEGFPYLDLVHYILQTSALIHRKAPLAAARIASTYISLRPQLDLNATEARALTRLAAYAAYRKSSEDGRKPEDGLQPWRRAIWQGATHGF